MKKRIKNITIIAAAYTGTLFGAGFVSGQEILRFFASWGSIGLVGTLLAGAGFAIVGIMIMLTARRLDTQDYEKIISPIGGIIPKAVNFLMSFWLFGIITVMLAAAGELFETVSGLHPLIGSSVMTLAVMSVHIFGKEGFTKVFSFVVPLMMVLGFGTAAIGALFGSDPVLSAGPVQSSAVAPHWLVSTALYISYNVLGNIGVLAPFGRDAQCEKDVKLGAVIGGGIPGLFALLLCLAMLSNSEIAFESDMPMYAIAAHISPVLGWVYAAALFTGIFTATCGISFSFLSRIDSYALPGILGKRVFMAPAVCILALIGSGLGFASLVGTVYPAYGWIGFFILGLMAVNHFKAKKAVKNKNLLS